MSDTPQKVPLELNPAAVTFLGHVPVAMPYDHRRVIQVGGRQWAIGQFAVRDGAFREWLRSQTPCPVDAESGGGTGDAT
jgi:hypothetical protein